MKWLRTLLTDDEDQWDLGFVLWAMGVLEYLGLSLWVYALRAWVTGVPLLPWDPMGFGTGLGLVLAAGGVMSRLRAVTTADSPSLPGGK